jgi:hypothetical protein
MVKRGFILALLLIVMGSLFAMGCAPQTQQYPAYNYSPGGTYGPGGMMGYGGMMGGGGMMGPGGPYRTGGPRITMDQAVGIVSTYLKGRNDPDIQAAEILEFSNNFYVGFKEKSTGNYAFEALIDPYTGDMYPEPGPNMMWNAKYGMMTGMMWGYRASSAPMTVTEDQAKKNAQDYLNSYLPGSTVGDADRFYGYYTVEVLKDNQIYSMLSVNGYTGQVWYHFWHGPFIAVKELG